MLRRSKVLQVITETCKQNYCLISHLGRTSRDLFAMTADIRSQCFHMLGAMGSVVPFTLGVSMSNKNVIAIGIEGDGSLLMNLGSLVTIKKLGGDNLIIVILDNGRYESTGGQQSQPGDDFELYKVCKSVGLDTRQIRSIDTLYDFFEKEIILMNGPIVLIVKTSEESPSARISDKPEDIGNRFKRWMTGINVTNANNK